MSNLLSDKVPTEEEIVKEEERENEPGDDAVQKKENVAIIYVDARSVTKCRRMREGVHALIDLEEKRVFKVRAKRHGQP